MAVFDLEEPLFPFIADYHLPYLVPVVVYWIAGLSFHYIEKQNLFTRFKLHTPAESLKKDRASREDVIRCAIMQQAAQVTLGYFTADVEMSAHGHDYHIMILAQRLASIFSFLERWKHVASNQVLNSQSITRAFFGASFYPNLGEIPNSPSSNQAYDTLHLDSQVPFVWQYNLGKILYWILIPMTQFAFAMILADSFQYFTHRGFHTNRWLYKNIHSMHHDIFVPFAYGAFYNHPLETIPIDCIGLPICLYLAGLSNRQSALFGAIWTYKTVVDHCGYNFPWNPSNIICQNSVLFHDLHHQVWGMKYNFSVYTSFWDRVLGTYWDGDDMNAKDKYLRGKEKAKVLVGKEEADVK
ncbi:fatty acid hydroxylase superfamily-domain-containing protein [Amylocarpus encephaloides]|uniref:Fatty acid hydroxylase superfamily-domain-containing protein n=1 Tax=Amylocarpus encephaloides TaxID=45428 RepID=A0A9P8C1V3_9HELO|nr:fatty acid hydroxylase superfamily-domain-containing protein [Amylocarpus encephaloides]